MSSLALRNLKVSADARAWIERFLADSILNDPVASLTFGRWSDEPDECWMVGGFERSQIADIEEQVAPYGHRAHYLVDGIELCFYQFHLLQELDGKSLHFDGQGFVVV